MKNIQLGQAIQVLANVGVIAGILFLAVEVHQNSEELATQARLDREEITRVSMARRFDNIELARATVKARAGESLSDTEEFLLNELNGAILVDRFLIYQQVQDGLLDPESIPIAAWRVTFHEQYPRMRESWDYHKTYLTPDFIAWYEENVIQYGSN